jgi:hypothetical protein
VSAIASFYVLDRRDIPYLEKAARGQGGDGRSGNDFWTALAKYGRRLPDAYHWSGYCLAYLVGAENPIHGL